MIEISLQMIDRRIASDRWKKLVKHFVKVEMKEYTEEDFSIAIGK